MRYTISFSQKIGRVGNDVLVFLFKKGILKCTLHQISEFSYIKISGRFMIVKLTENITKPTLWNEPFIEVLEKS